MIDRETLLMAGKIWVHLREDIPPDIMINGIRIRELRIVNDAAKYATDYELTAFDPYEVDFIHTSFKTNLSTCKVQVSAYAPIRGERHPRAEWTVVSKQRLIDLCVQIATK